jgi:hypothetical protein
VGTLGVGMSIDIDRFARLRPYLYHLTARSNVASIARSRRLLCTSAMLEKATTSQVRNEVRRLAIERIQTPNGVVTIRDQSPLHSGHIEFESGWDMNRFVSHVNKHVFTWPGSERGPIRPGLNHYARYAAEAPLLLRFPTSHAAIHGPKFCRFNSGAPRCSGGKHSPRGSATYVTAAEFQGALSEVVEVVFEQSLDLPVDVEYAETYDGPWRRLLADAELFLQADG